jgi:hypothetical protein
MKPAAASSPMSERGFVLPAVVMFVIVLTILGLSLFTLSSYEAQFMNATLDETQAFYLANGAIDRARYLLTAPGHELSSVQTNRDPGVDYAVAIQDPYGNPDSVGDWTQNQTDPSPPILVRVVVEKNGYKRKLEALFDPSIVQQYDKLFSMSSPTRGLHVVEDPTGTTNNEYCVGLDGRLWQTYKGVSPPDGTDLYDWYGDIFDCYNNYITPEGTLNLNTTMVGTTVPFPQVQTFLAGFPAASDPGSGNSFDLFCYSQSESVGYFRSPGGLNITTGTDVTISVHGIAVWAFDHGFWSQNRKVTVTGTSKDMLVLVAHQDASANPLYGLWFDGGLDSRDVPVILVSDQRIMIDSQPSQNFRTTMGWVSMYAPSAWIRGPKLVGTKESPANLFLYYHPANNANAEHSLDNLFDKRALPNVNGPRNSLAYKPGTWREFPTN